MLKRREDGKDYQSPNPTRKYRDIFELLNRAERTDRNIDVINSSVHGVWTAVQTPDVHGQPTTSTFTTVIPALTNIDQTTNNCPKKTWL